MGYSLFVGMLVAQETTLLRRLVSDGNALPVLWTWRMLYPLGVLGVALLLPITVRWFLLGIVGVLSALLLIGDGAYFTYFQSVTSLDAATSVGQLWTVRHSVATLVSVLDLWYLLPHLGLIAYGVHRVRRREESPRWAWLVSALVGVALLALVAGLGKLAERTPIHEETHHLDRPDWVLPVDHYHSRYSKRAYAATFGVYNYHVMDAIRKVTRHFGKPTLAESRKQTISQTLRRKHDLNQQRSPLFGIAEGRSVLILQLESIQHFVLDLAFSGEEVMPKLNLLAKQGLRFDQIMDITGFGRTSDAEFALMTSLMPDIRKAAAFDHIGNAAVTLAGQLRELGYKTASFHGNEPSFWNRSYTHPNWGIQHMYFEDAYPPGTTVALGVPDPIVYSFLADRLDEWRATPSFSYVISVSSHHPYTYAPAEYRGLFPEIGDVPDYGLLGGYLASARYADDALAGLFAELERRDLMQNLLVVIFGDHDVGSLIAKRLPPGMDHLVGLQYDRIPLLILVPGRESELALHAKQYRDVTGGLHDLMPTILHLLGQPTPYGVMGSHLFVPNVQRSPLLLPVLPESFVYAGMMSSLSKVVPIATPPEPLPALPPFEVALREQLVVQDMMDHPDLHLQHPDAK